MPDPLCPTCHNKIGTDSLTEAGRTQGAEGLDLEGNPIPAWSDDPIFTAQGLSGDIYKKQNRVRFSHIVEIQTKRTQQETDSGISPLTSFSDVVSDFHISRRHVVELRESTEKLLAADGLTLEDYFKQGPEGENVAQNSRLVNYGAASPQTEWIDVNRGEQYIDATGAGKSTFVLPGNITQQSPTLPASVHIRGVHIEDLRHPLDVGIKVILVSGDFTLFKGKLTQNIESTKVKKVVVC